MPDPFVLAAPIEHTDLNRKVYDHLRAAVLSGALKSGQKINLAELAEQLDVSRSPVHQALTRLAAEGLVQVRPRRGYLVTPVTMKALVEEYEVRQVLELTAAERTVGKLDPEQMRELGEALQDTLQAVGEHGAWDLHRYVQTNQRFHRLQFDFAGNEVLTSVYASLRVSLLMERVLEDAAFGEEIALLGEQHAALFHAHQHGDLRAARSVIEAHVETGRQMATKALEAAGGAR